MNTGFIPFDKYKEIWKVMPVVCVDIVLHYKGKVLLLYRKDEPVKDHWWISGGRVFRDEMSEDAARRKAKEELGIDIEFVKKIGVYEKVFPADSLEDMPEGVHNLIVTYLVKPANGNTEIKLDHTSEDYKWIDHIEEDLHPHIKEVLKDSGVFN